MDEAHTCRASNGRESSTEQCNIEAASLSRVSSCHVMRVRLLCLIGHSVIIGVKLYSINRNGGGNDISALMNQMQLK